MSLPAPVAAESRKGGAFMLTTLPTQDGPASTTPGRLARLRGSRAAQACATGLVTLAFVVGVPTAAMAQTTAPDPSTVITNAGTSGATQLGVLVPVVITAVLAVGVLFWGGRTILHKLGFGGRVTKI